MKTRFHGLGVLVLALACGPTEMDLSDAQVVDTGFDATDAGVMSMDALSADVVGRADGGIVDDGGILDSGIVDDSGILDSSIVDGGIVDAGSRVDAGPLRTQLQLEYTVGDALMVVQTAITTADGDYVVAGDYRVGADRAPYVARVSSRGDVEWANRYLQDDGGFVVQILELASGDLMLAGTHHRLAGAPSSADGLLMRLRPDGSPVWRRAFGGDAADAFSSLTHHPDGYFAAGGYSRTYSTPFVVRVNEDGSLRGAFSVSSATANSGWSAIANGPGGDLWVAIAAQFGSGDTTPMLVRVTSADTVRTSQRLQWGTKIMSLVASESFLTLGSDCSVGSTATAWCFADYAFDSSGLTTGSNPWAAPFLPYSVSENASGETVYAGTSAADSGGPPRVLRVGADGEVAFQAFLQAPMFRRGTFVAGFAEAGFTTAIYRQRFVLARFDDVGSAGCLSVLASTAFSAPALPAPDVRVAAVLSVATTMMEVTAPVVAVSLTQTDLCPP